MTARKALKAATITGRTVHDPQRFRGRASPKGLGPIGEPFAIMTEAQREAWKTFVGELPWLNRSHRAILQLACVLRARIEADPTAGVAALQVFSAVLSKLGATPVDESKITDPDDEPDAADRFFN